jgi:hypothetical protein
MTSKVSVPVQVVRVTIENVKRDFMSIVEAPKMVVQIQVQLNCE